jgi:hypothetical protein
MTTSPTHICVVQDAYTRQFHHTSMEQYREVYEGRHGDHLTGHCGVLDKRRKAAVIFIEDGQIDAGEFENFVAYCTHRFKVAPRDVVKLSKPSRAKSVEMIQNMIDQMIKKVEGDIEKYNEKRVSEQRSREEDSGATGYGELGFDDFRDEHGNDTWQGD